MSHILYTGALIYQRAGCLGVGVICLTKSFIINH